MDHAAASPLHPPKPRLTLRVGITGHRPNKLDGAAAAQVARQLPGVFAAIERAAAQVRLTDGDVYSDAAPLLRLISGFAEGADQIAVAACPATWHVEAILPFPKDEYLKDFASSAGDGRDVSDPFLASLSRASAVTELPIPASGNRDHGYAAAGGYMLRQIDVLIAAWDGRPPQPGGTGAIAREAFAGGIPVVWLAVGEARPPRLITEFDHQGTPIAADADCTAGSLTQVLSALVSAPRAAGNSTQGSTQGSPQDTARASLDRYLGERWRSRSVFAAYDGLRRVATRRLPRLFVPHTPFDQRRHDWDAFLQSAPDATDMAERVTNVLLPRFIWADTLAVHFSHLYRSAYVLAYFLSALAVFIALLSVFLHEDSHDTAHTVLSTKAVFVGCELVIITVILALVTFGRRLAWHERWLDYRALAEMLRHGRFLAFVSEFGRNRETAPTHGTTPWPLWYIRATMREIGLPTAVMDRHYQSRILDATLEDEIAGPGGQLAYHAANSKNAHRIDHMLHVLGMICFGFTSAILFAFLLLFLLEHVTGWTWLMTVLTAAKPYVTFFSAGLPALGAAVAGIRVHGDFEGAVERSHGMVDQLEALKADYAALQELGTDLDTTSDTLIATARVLSEDLAAWQDLYGRKRLSLPA
jgi:hypothetical protein